jgi:spore coat protein U-like protein
LFHRAVRAFTPRSDCANAAAKVVRFALAWPRAIALAAILTASLAAAPALAQGCTVTNASGSYGNVDALSGAASDSTSTFTVTCQGSKNKTVRLCIEMGAGSPTDAGKRALSNGTKYLDHEFYSDPSRTQVWGSWGSVVAAYGNGGVTVDLPFGGNSSVSKTFTVYARVLANQQTVAPMTYTWSDASPGIRHGYQGTAPCPTGNNTKIGGSTVLRRLSSQTARFPLRA